MQDLRKLGWYTFQQLCHTIIREILGQTVESYLDSSDGGRDGAFNGTWSARNGEQLSGNFVIQCKFTSKVNYNLKASDIFDELEKARKLVERNLCDSYVLMTNAGLSGTEAEKITASLKDVGVKQVLILGSTWINQQIRENRRLRMLVPRLYGFGDLSQILDERAYVQARTILESMREDLAKVVVTDSYKRAVEAINEHSFVLLIGEPASGKTTIASLLAIAALDQWNASPIKLYEPRSVSERWNPDEPSQFFWLDDAFGVTQYDDAMVRSWNHILPQIRPMIRRGAKIVMTSRDYIYNRARNHLKESAFPLLNESQVVVDVHNLSGDEKRQILYNHLKLGKQPRSFRSEIKPYLEGLVGHQRFIPEIARRLADPLFTKDLFINEYGLNQFVERREQLLQEVLRGLDTDSTAALALIYMRNGRLQSPIELRSSEAQALQLLGSNLGACVVALDALNGSLVRLIHAGGESFWEFKHPTVGDAFAARLVQSPESLGIFIQGSAPEGLVNRVTCGDVGIEKAVVLPKSLFPQMLVKLEILSQRKLFGSAWLSAFKTKGALQGFLANRCSREFLSLYLQKHPDLLDKVSVPGLYLNSVPEVRLAERLHEFNLLPEKNRKKFVETVSNYVLEGEDSGPLSDEGIRSLFTRNEFKKLVERVRTRLLPRLDDVRFDWESNYNPSESPEEYMEQLLEFLNSLKVVFGDDERTVQLIDRQICCSEEWVNDNSVVEPDSGLRQLEKAEVLEKPKSTRNIFDDIDAD